jgi:hypothetical protein
MELTEKERLGLIMENFVKAQLSSLGFQKVKHTGKESYTNKDNQTKRGVDFKVYGEHGQLATAIEAKNWKTLKRKYGKDIAQTEVVDRFAGVNAKFKVLVISNFDVFDKQAQELILSSGIHVFETEKLIGAKIFKTRDFYTLKSRLEKFFENLETEYEGKQKRDQTLISQYLQQNRPVCFSSCCSNNSSLIPLIQSLTYDTHLETVTRETIETIEKMELPVSEIEQLAEKVNISFD